MFIVRQAFKSTNVYKPFLVSGDALKSHFDKFENALCIVTSTDKLPKYGLKKTSNLKSTFFFKQIYLILFASWGNYTKTIKEFSRFENLCC